jgi:hypothetical protein
MGRRYYYSHDEIMLGPYSARELRQLAAAGEIRPTDTVWKEGIERGVQADRLRTLFPPAGADVVRPDLRIAAVETEDTPCPSPSRPSASVPSAGGPESLPAPDEPPGPGR